MSGLTGQQREAVEARGNILVVAGAGTGKTSTLVARCLRLIEEGCSLENILMVTFTEAAAGEMRHRIRTALESRWREQGDDAANQSARDLLEQQLALLDTAHISTLHGFCLHLIRAHFHLLPVDPQVLVLDERQTAPLIRQALDEVLLRHYEGRSVESEAVRALIRGYGRGSDVAIRELITRLHRYSQSRGDTEAWLDAQERAFRESSPVSWQQHLLVGLPAWRLEWAELLRPLSDIPVIAASLAALEKITDHAIPATLATAFDAILAADADTQKWARKKGEARRRVRVFFEEAAFLRSQFPSANAPDPLAADWEQIRHPMLALLRLTREFTEVFSRAKRDLGGVDFADLEQLALRLLREPDGAPSAVALAWRTQFQHVFVDEYQDINGAQDAILAALSREGTEANRFLVGDIKQSIYRFRLANPDIFRHYEHQWRTDPAAGARLPLTENFRSREAILNFVNAFFAPLMREEIGGVRYDADAQLRFGAAEERVDFSAAADAQGATRPRVELHLLARPPEAGDDEPAADDTVAAARRNVDEVGDLDAVQREARLITTRLRELHQGSESIWDKDLKRFRAAKWSDMVVLLRSPRGKVEVFAQEFHRAGIPLQATRGGFFETLEVMDLLNLLRLLDNPLQDVPLLAVLRSPLGGFSLDELATFRAHNTERLAWPGLHKFHRDRKAGATSPITKSAWQKTEEFLARFARWRELIRKTSLSHCLERALIETHYEAFLLARPRGAERMANVRRLLDLARDYDPFQRQGLYRFLRFVDIQLDAEVTDESASAPVSDAVRLMSIHQSKGQEFPVLVVANLGKLFNEQGLRDGILLDEQHGLCPRVVNPDTGAHHPGLTWWLARRREQRELRGEEMRLLYVALTRARDLLILTGATPLVAEKLHWESTPGATISEREVAGARSYMDWIRQWLPLVTRTEDWLSDFRGRTELFQWQIHTHAAAAVAATEPGTAADGLKVLLDDVTVEDLRRKFTWRYPYGPATSEPAKTSVTALKRRWQQEDEEAAAAEWAKVHAAATAQARAAVAGELSPAEIGIAHHTFLQHVSLGRAASLLDLRNEANRLLRTGLLSEAEMAALNFHSLLAFWQSELGWRIQKNAARVEREVPFTLRITPAELADLTGKSLAPEMAAGFAPQEDYLLVQGFADLIVRFEKEIWLLDFKTDRVTRAGLPAKLETYRPQLRVYGEALAKIYRRPVTEKWLHFLALDQSVAVP